MEENNKNIKESKTPIYGLGSPDPIAFTSTCLISPGGIDTAVFLGEEPQGNLQSITFESGLFLGAGDCYTPYLTGDLTYCLCCNEKTQGEELKIAFGSLVGRKFNLKLVAASKNTDKLVLFDRKVQLIGYKSGISIDDIVMEYVYKFKVVD